MGGILNEKDQICNISKNLLTPTRMMRKMIMMTPYDHQSVSSFVCVAAFPTDELMQTADRGDVGGF